MSANDPSVVFMQLQETMTTAAIYTLEKLLSHSPEALAQLVLRPSALVQISNAIRIPARVWSGNGRDLMADAQREPDGELMEGILEAFTLIQV